MKMTKLKYEDLEFPTFVNSCPAVTFTAYGKKGKELIELPFSDIPKAIMLFGGSFLSVGDTGCGKSQLMIDIHRNYFGGNADDGGKSNWTQARNDFSAENFFMTLNQDKVGEGKGMLAEARVPVKKRVKALCNIVDEVNLTIPEIQVEFFGMAEGRHKGTRLGDKGYYAFMASCNLNRLNGEFAGTSQISRALLNRFHFTFDFDYFPRTEEDESILEERENTGRLELAPIRDISDKIIQSHSDIQAKSSQKDPWLDAYIRFFSTGLEYCNIDGDKRKKTVWPMRCSNCDFKTEEKDLCSLVKQSTPRTKKALKLFANSLNYIVNLKHGNKSLDPFDLVSEAFKFTTYHGNLNSIETASEKYNGEHQEQMRDVLGKIREAVTPIKPYIDMAIDNVINKGVAETRFIKLENNEDKFSVYSKETEKILKKMKASYTIFDPFTEVVDGENFEQRTGLGVSWFPSYLKNLAQNYKNKEQNEK